MSLSDFAPQEATFKAEIIDGKDEKTGKTKTRIVELTLRPFTLRDADWYQKALASPEDIMRFVADTHELKVEPMARMIWHQLTGEGKQIFLKMKFIKEDPETGAEIEAGPEGWERLVEAMFRVEDLLEGFWAFIKCREGNSFLGVDEDISPEKKKRRTTVTGR